MLLRPLVLTPAILLCLTALSVEARTPRTAPAIQNATTTAPAADAAANSSTAGDFSAAVRELNGLLDRVEASGQVSGLAVAVVKDDHVLLQRGIGYADATTRSPVTPDTVFRLASLSKAFASALAALLVQDGVFGWDTRINDVSAQAQFGSAE